MPGVGSDITLFPGSPPWYMSEVSWQTVARDEVRPRAGEPPTQYVVLQSELQVVPDGCVSGAIDVYEARE